MVNPPPTGSRKYVTLRSGEWLEAATPAARLGARAIDIVVFVVLGWSLMAVLLVSVFSEDFNVLLDPAVDPATVTELRIDDQAARGALSLVISGAVALLAVGVLYEVAFIALKGQTPGKMAARIAVVSIADGSVPGWGKSIGRWSVPGLPLLVPGLGLIWAGLVYLSITWDPRLLGWHDKVAGTAVVKHERVRNPMI